MKIPLRGTFHAAVFISSISISSGTAAKIEPLIIFTRRWCKGDRHAVLKASIGKPAKS